MNSIRHIFIIVPAATMTSPIKGAAALANGLIEHFSISFISLKPATSGFSLLDERVEKISLSELGGWPARLFGLRKLLKNTYPKGSAVAISYCLSADLLNSLCDDLIMTCASVRGNLPVVYSETYGRLGWLVAKFHFSRLSCIDCVISMTETMSAQVQSIIGRDSPVIGNFVDESVLSEFRNTAPRVGPFKFVYTGSMIYGKQPQLLLTALNKIQKMGVNAELDMFGDGPLLQSLREQSLSLPNPDLIRFHGHVSNIYKSVASADVLILPSLTEGVSRSVLEALFLGVPCVLRRVDGNAELIRDGVNGGLFENDDEIADLMVRTAEWSRKENVDRKLLLPPQFSQHNAIQNFIKLLESYNAEK